MPKYCISDLVFEINAPEWVLHDNLKIFLCNLKTRDLYLDVVFEKCAAIPLEEAELIFKTAGTSVYVIDGRTHLINSDGMGIISDITASEDWATCKIYINLEYNNPEDEEMAKQIRENVFAALQKIYFAVLGQKQGVAIHSSSIIWNDQGVLFSASSGTGKTTHTQLWKELYNTKVLDGDVTACRMINRIPFVYGIPWCGSSGEFMNHRVPLKAIVFLQKAKENKIEKLNLLEAFSRLISNCFMLPLNDKMMNRYLDIIHDIAGCADCYLLNCLPDYDAVELVKKCLEAK